MVSAAVPVALFVSLSRVRHPDNLMLDDDFPSYFKILQSGNHAKFRKRQAWERIQRVKFSKTVRQFMRDPSRYTPERCWTEEESHMADIILAMIKRDPNASDDYFAENSGRAGSGMQCIIAKRLEQAVHVPSHVRSRIGSREAGLVRFGRAHHCNHINAQANLPN